MRSIFGAVLLLLSAGIASASCVRRPIGETLPSFRDAVEARLTSAGLRVAYLGGEPEDGTIYALQPSAAGMRLVSDSSLAMREIGTDVPKPSNDTDVDAAMTVAAFAVARLSAEPEPKVKDALYADLTQHPGSTTWLHRWGGTVAVSTSSERGLVVRIYKADCD